MAKLPLDGIRVIDLSMWFAGPMASRLMADMGAEVIKIESLKHMDPWRGPVKLTPKAKERFPVPIDAERPYNCGAAFNLQNRNKLGITLDIAKPKGKQLFKKLVKISDIVLENYSPRVMKKIELDYSVLKELNPQIIMMSMPALGRTGPDKDYVAFGHTIDCMSGMAYRTGYTGEEPMLQSGLAYGDPISGMNAALACLMALNHRRKSGNGIHIELSQVEGLISFNADAIMNYTMNNRIQEKMGNRHPSIAPHGCYKCKGEDQWVTIAIPSDVAWKKFCEVTGNTAWIKDDRFSDSLNRYKNQKELDKLINEWTMNHDHYEIMHILQKDGIPSGPVLDAKELIEDPHLNERNFFETVSHPEAGTHPYIGMYAKLSKTPGSIRRPAPCLGEHNSYVYGDLLGLSDNKIDELKKEGIIGTDPVENQVGGIF